jgi:hypothetical protein
MNIDEEYGQTRVTSEWSLDRVLREYDGEVPKGVVFRTGFIEDLSYCLRRFGEISSFTYTYPGLTLKNDQSGGKNHFELTVNDAILFPLVSQFLRFLGPGFPIPDATLTLHCEIDPYMMSPYRTPAEHPLIYIFRWADPESFIVNHPGVRFIVHDPQRVVIQPNVLMNVMNGVEFRGIYVDMSRMTMFTEAIRMSVETYPRRILVLPINEYPREFWEWVMHLPVTQFVGHVIPKDIMRFRIPITLYWIRDKETDYPEFQGIVYSPALETHRPRIEEGKLVLENVSIELIDALLRVRSRVYQGTPFDSFVFGLPSLSYGEVIERFPRLTYRFMGVTFHNQASAPDVLKPFYDRYEEQRRQTQQEVKTGLLAVNERLGISELHERIFSYLDPRLLQHS